MGDCTEGGVASFAACTRGSALEESTHEFAPELKVLAVPPNLKVANDILGCEATCELEGNCLKVRRSIDGRTPGPICSPATNAANQQLLKKVLANLKAQVVYGSP